MPVTINTNTAASTAARALEVANKNLTDSLKKLSTGNRIVNNMMTLLVEAVELKSKAKAPVTTFLKTISRMLSLFWRFRQVS